MGATIRVKGDRNLYAVRDRECIGRACLRLHPIEVRGATSSGSRSTGRYTYECGERHYRGCPKEPDSAFSKVRAALRRNEGMRVI